MIAGAFVSQNDSQNLWSSILFYDLVSRGYLIRPGRHLVLAGSGLWGWAVLWSWLKGVIIVNSAPPLGLRFIFKLLL